MQNPDLQKWLLAPDGIATQLRALRGATIGKEFAAAAGMRPGKLSKLELAQQLPTEEDIRSITAAANAPADLTDTLIAKLADRPGIEASARQNRFGQVATQKRLTRLAQNSRTVRMYEPIHMPRPVQTLSYATAVLAGQARLNGARDESTDAASVLTGAWQVYAAARITLLLTEQVLYLQPVDDRALRTQLLQLLDRASANNVDLLILPEGVQPALLPPAGFALLDNVGYTDTLDGATELAGERLAGYAAAFTALADAAESGEQATRMVEAAVQRLAESG